MESLQVDRSGDRVQITFESHHQIPGLTRAPITVPADPVPKTKSTSKRISRTSKRDRQSKRSAQATQDDISNRSKSEHTLPSELDRPVEPPHLPVVEVLIDTSQPTISVIGPTIARSNGHIGSRDSEVAHSNPENSTNAVCNTPQVDINQRPESSRSIRSTLHTPAFEALLALLNGNRPPTPSLPDLADPTVDDKLGRETNKVVDSSQDDVDKRSIIPHGPIAAQVGLEAIISNTPPPTPVVARRRSTSLIPAAVDEGITTSADDDQGSTNIGDVSSGPHLEIHTTSDKLQLPPTPVVTARIPTPPITPTVNEADSATTSGKNPTKPVDCAAEEVDDISQDIIASISPSAAPPIPLEAIGTIRRVSANLARALNDKGASDREEQLSVAVGILSMCLQVHFVPYLDAWRADASHSKAIVPTSTARPPSIPDPPKKIAFSIPSIPKPTPTGPRITESVAQALLLARPPSRETLRTQLASARATISSQADQIKRQAEDFNSQGKVLEMKGDTITQLREEVQELITKCQRSDEQNKQLEGEIFRLEGDMKRLEEDKQRAIDQLGRYVQSSSQTQLTAPRASGTVPTLIRNNQLQRKELEYQNTQLNIKQAQDERLRRLPQEPGISAELNEDLLQTWRELEATRQREWDGSWAGPAGGWSEQSEIGCTKEDRAGSESRQDKDLERSEGIETRRDDHLVNQRHRVAMGVEAQEMENERKVATSNIESQEEKREQGRRKAGDGPVWDDDEINGSSLPRTQQDVGIPASFDLVKNARQDSAKDKEAEMIEEADRGERVPTTPTKSFRIKGLAQTPEMARSSTTVAARVSQGNAPAGITKLGAIIDSMRRISPGHSLRAKPRESNKRNDSPTQLSRSDSNTTNKRARRATISINDDHRSPWERSRTAAQTMRNRFEETKIPSGPRILPPTRAEWHNNLSKLEKKFIPSGPRQSLPAPIPTGPRRDKRKDEGGEDNSRAIYIAHARKKTMARFMGTK